MSGRLRATRAELDALLDKPSPAGELGELIDVLRSPDVVFDVRSTGARGELLTHALYLRRAAAATVEAWPGDPRVAATLTDPVALVATLARLTGLQDRPAPPREPLAVPGAALDGLLRHVGTAAALRGPGHHAVVGLATAGWWPEASHAERAALTDLAAHWVGSSVVALVAPEPAGPVAFVDAGPRGLWRAEPGERGVVHLLPETLGGAWDALADLLLAVP